MRLIPLLWFVMSLAPSLYAEKVVIGLASNFSAIVDPLTDPSINYPRKAAELALQDFKLALQARNLDVEFQEFDYQEGKIMTLKTAQAIAKSSAIAVIGYTNSSDTLLAGPILNKAQVPFLTPAATADRVEHLGRYVRRLCFDDAFQGRLMAEFAWKDQKAKSIAIVSVSDCAYCQSLRQNFRERYLSLGGHVAADEVILSSDTNFDDLTKKLKGKRIDAVFVPNYERTAARLLPALIDAGISPRVWLAGDGWGTTLQLFHRSIGRRPYKAFAIAHWRPEVKNPLSQKFYAAFRERYQLEPNDTAATTYDGVRLLLEALLKAPVISREALILELEKIRTFSGATGTMSYQEGKRTPDKSAVLVKMTEGRVTTERLLGSDASP